jgi:cyclopropane fatty-acyl-phospholipid synthase-like methyltransferase
MTKEKRDFDKDAASWDEKPIRIEMANNVGSAIISTISLNKNMKAMDFGCGTGLLTLYVAPLVGSVTGVDSSQGMLDTLNAKIAKLNITNVTTRLIDSDNFVMPKKYDLIVSSMTMHHIEKVELLIKNFYDLLLPNGYLCIADLDPDDGRFHEDNTGVFHYGFERSKMTEIFTSAGFQDTSSKTAMEIQRPDTNGELRLFKIFLVTGNKK